MKRYLKKSMSRLLRFTGKIPNNSKILYPFWLAARLDTVEENLYFDKLPEYLDGLVIAFASDPHYGAFLSRERVIDLSRRLDKMQADIVILTGDYGQDAKTAADFFDILPKVKARYAVFASLGNHDHMGSRAEIANLASIIEKSGIRLLANTAEILQINGSSLCICATDDILEAKPDFAPLKDAAAQSDFTIFAPHSPDIIPQALTEPGFCFDLALCGHTHGGQLVMFGRSLLSSSRFGDKYRTGLIDLLGKQLLVSNGVGTSLLPIRVGTRPQIHRVTLHKI